ncbi:HNH endonuclease [Proteus mirabilis]|uniref:HNH endonuclease n=1 Tax=Proteus mirabilis TaxID=584 RepID=UPI001623D88B|nr:HNH endonuclease [Proteus mirabilis]EKW4023970.1 HNH endonuclease [Proteus mirabilis]MBB6658522.1 HNH endonuclease [Proteus mirabilis]MBG2713791.1 HNH endonuclease [Proteus mirabilis]MBI6274046.1 HNH endonuclease [Proteus mirabilis]HDU8345110.1 HNH endonuclease [Proteus mirabilis]
MKGDFKEIESFNFKLYFSRKDKKLINALIRSSLGHEQIWSGSIRSLGLVRKERDELKNNIKKQLLKLQDGFCPYCGFKFSYRTGERGTRNIQREHIAPKATYKVYTFTTRNLVLACSICNGSDYKSNCDTIDNLGGTYSDCTFKIIHPYLDKRSEHLRLDSNTGLYKCINGKPKGKFTVELFGLNERFHVENRKLHLDFDKYKVNSYEEIIRLLTSQNHSV